MGEMMGLFALGLLGLDLLLASEAFAITWELGLEMRRSNKRLKRLRGING
jgi:hypothetical protein